MAAESPTTNLSANPWRRAMKTAVSALLVECGYQSADNMALETLLEIMQSCEIIILFLLFSIYKFVISP